MRRLMRYKGDGEAAGQGNVIVVLSDSVVIPFYREERESDIAIISQFETEMFQDTDEILLDTYDCFSEGEAESLGFYMEDYRVIQTSEVAY